MTAVRLDIVPDKSAEPPVGKTPDCRLFFSDSDIRRINKCILHGYAVCKIIVYAVNDTILRTALHDLYPNATV